MSDVVLLPEETYKLFCIHNNLPTIPVLTSILEPVCGCRLFFFFLYVLRRMGKIKLKPTTLLRIFMHVVCQFNSIVCAIQLYDRCL